MSKNKNYKRAQQLFDINKYEKAIPYLHKYLAEEPNASDSAIYMLGWSYVKTKKYEKAIEYAKILVVSNIDVFKAVGHHIFAIYYSFNNNRDKALISIDKALNINPNSTGFLSEKAQIHINRGEEKIALEIIKSLLKISPNDVTALKLKNEIYGAKKSKFNEAKSLTEDILRLEPDNASSFKSSALTMQQNGLYEEAYQLYTKSLLIDPTDNEVILNMNVVHIYKSNSIFNFLDKVKIFFLKHGFIFLIVSIIICFWSASKVNNYPTLIIVPLFFSLLCLISFNLFSKNFTTLFLLFKKQTKKILFKKNKKIGFILLVTSITTFVTTLLFITYGTNLYAKLSLLSYTVLFQVFLLENNNELTKTATIFAIISNSIAVLFYMATSFFNFWVYNAFFYTFFIIYMFAYFMHVGLTTDDDE
ncbi:tetratricopeptide repeat protein [uncultured Algibacter sp.]|uniref:tetratricopeptide repeat protein n=1 Tax=uncultured Algibacter sp. TaxID=298659 RepID=UPI003217B243